MSKSASAPSDHLTDRATLDSTIKVLEQYFNLSANGYICQTRDLYQILVTAAASGRWTAARGRGSGRMLKCVEMELISG